MRTLPATFTEHARDGSAFIWLVDVFPTAADSWTQIRWAERAVTVAGNVYAAGYIQAIDPIKYSAKILRGGAVATRDGVSIHLLDKDRSLYRMIQERNLDGRDVQVSLALMPLNLVRNSSFESPTSGDNFDFWTETLGHASNAIQRATTGATHGSQLARLICNATPGPQIQSDAFKVRAESTLSLSFNAHAGGPTSINVRIVCGGLYWNDSTKKWQPGAVSKSIAITTTSARYTMEGLYDKTPSWATEELDVYVVFEAPNVGTVVLIDAVQVEARLRASSYHPGRYDMAAADLYPVYWGEIRAPKWDRGAIQLATKSIMNRRHRDIPTTILTQSIDADWVIPPENLGKPFPITLGNFAVDSLGFGEIFPRRTAAVGLLANASAAVDPVRVYFDKPGVTFGDGTLYHFSPDSMRFYREYLNSDSSFASEWQRVTSDSCHESKSTAKQLRQGLMRLNAFLFATEIDEASGDYASWTNPDNLVDGDLNSFAELTMTGIDATGKTLYFRIQKPQEFSGFKLLKAYAIAKVTPQLNSGSATRDIRHFNTHGFVSLATTGTFDNVPSGLPYDADEQLKEFSITSVPNVQDWLDSAFEYYIRVILSAGSSPNVTFKLYAAGIRLDFCIDLVDAIICKSTLGRPYGDTWGGRKTAASAVSGPVDFIEAILRQELGVTTAEINTARFDAANTDYGSRGATAGQVTEIKPSTEVIGEICEATGLVYYVDGAGKEAIACLKHGTAAKRLRPRDFGLDRIEPEYIAREEIVSDFTLRWGYVPGADVYVGYTFCNRLDSNIGDSSYETKCANAYAALGNRENRREYECRWVNNESDAQGLLKFLIDWTRARRRIVKAQGWFDQLDLEFGDRVDLQIEEYLIERDTDTERPIFTPYEYVIRKTGSEARVDVSFLEVTKP